MVFNAAELIGTIGKINATTPFSCKGYWRLNYHLNGNVKPPFQRAASHIAEALLSLIHDASPLLVTPGNLILRSAAYRFFEAPPRTTANETSEAKTILLRLCIFF
ncbi:unnamed protein product [Microthlaspi erraticum]|uniref:Uncharacterized protein n=1 Tax=Microthlaspi erraticum TaxID=1685480 RepID=A0A6D2K0F6_9BRAS|nr:unnamed protein product [Microthlaspi erraticum]